MCQIEKQLVQVFCMLFLHLSSITATLVRLSDGKSDSHGRVEVYNDRTGWGTICNSGWTAADAAVFCRQLGFADGQVHP